MSNGAEFLVRRSGETDDEARFRESIERQASQLLATLDAVIALRTAPAAAARIRHLARGDLQNFALKAMHSFALTASDS